jgi:serine/threonine protein kinase
LRGDLADADLGSDASAAAVRSGDRRMIEALETYLESLREGRSFSASEFLSQHSDLSGDLTGCLAGLEFIEAAAAALPGSTQDVGAVERDPERVSSPPTRLGDYNIVRELGRGGMGVVYEARQVSLGRRVALKVLPYAAATDPKQRQRFQIEAQAAAQLQHPHIVPVFGVGCDAGIHYYAMQFIDGNSLSSIIRELRTLGGIAIGWLKTSPLAETAVKRAEYEPMPTGELSLYDATTDLAPAPEKKGSSHFGLEKSGHDRAHFRMVTRVGIEAADALEHAHSLGVLHRDIKPANLLIDREGGVWITDFGLARFTGDSSLTGSGDVVGTLRYMSPEQAMARRGVVDQRTDVYALGATLYELLTLRPAFDGRDHQELLRQIALDEPVPPRRHNPSVPRDLETIVLKAMAKDPGRRYGTAQELSDDLKRFMNDDPIMGRRPGSIERTIRWARRRWEVVSTSAAILLVSLFAGAAVTFVATERERIRFHDFVVSMFPVVDRSASQLAGPDVGDEVMSVFQQASELPPNDTESRVVIARALSKLASARTLRSLKKGTPEVPEPLLMAQARAEFERSIALFEKLLAEQPGDPLVTRYYADALGLFGMGCHLRFSHCDKDAEAYYRRAIDLRRSLIRNCNRRAPAALPFDDLSGEHDDPMRLTFTVQTVAMLMASSGREAEADALYDQLEEDFRGVAERYQGPTYRDLRRNWVSQLLESQSSAHQQMLRRIWYRHTRLALVVDPENAQAHNSAAWAMVSVPEDPWYDPNAGRERARKAIELDPNNWSFWNTLGVAFYRAGDWKAADETLRKSIEFTGGTAHDWFFVAMALWHQGKHPEARQCFESAVSAMKSSTRNDPELVRFHAEASAVLQLKSDNAELGMVRTSPTAHIKGVFPR